MKNIFNNLSLFIIITIITGCTHGCGTDNTVCPCFNSEAITIYLTRDNVDSLKLYLYDTVLVNLKDSVSINIDNKKSFAINTMKFKIKNLKDFSYIIYDPINNIKDTIRKLKYTKIESSCINDKQIKCENVEVKDFSFYFNTKLYENYNLLTYISSEK